MAKQYMFVAGGDACGICAGLDGTISDGGIGPQHENCHCQDVPVDDDLDCPRIDVLGVEVRTDGPSATVSAEVTLHCCDGTEIGESVEQDLGPASLPVDEIIAELSEEVASAVAAMAEGCPEGIPVWVEDGEEEGLA